MGSSDSRRRAGAREARTVADSPDARNSLQTMNSVQPVCS